MAHRAPPDITQDDIIAFLASPDAYGTGEPVTRMDTHISVIFLTGNRAYKMKRAVKFDYLDYTNLDQRRRFCAQELAINMRTAPGLYLSVLPVTCSCDGTLHLDGPGEPVEWLVEMNQFAQENLFDQMVAEDRLTPRMMTELSDEIAAFHNSAAQKGDGASVMRWVAGSNAHEMNAHASEIFDPDRVQRLTTQTDDYLDRLSPLLDARAAAGFVRHCHGDMHLRNICLYEGRPTLFDGIEFNDAITNIDVLYDLAFLLMDLDHREHRDLASIVFNRYVAMTGDVGGLAALPLFLSCRAAIRAHVAAAASATHPDEPHQRRLAAEARAYLDLALTYLSPTAPRLIAVGGLSGTGKSTLAARLAPGIGAAPGALVLRSDMIRKRLHGVVPETNLPPDAYTPEQSARVYEKLTQDAAAALTAGHSVIVDAVFAKQNERRAMAEIAQNADVPFAGLWLTAPAAILQQRVTDRIHDASDADAGVVDAQLGYDTGPVDWPIIDAGHDAGLTYDSALLTLLNNR